MKRILHIVCASALLFAGCAKEPLTEKGTGDGCVVLKADFGGVHSTRSSVPADYVVKIGTSEGYTHIFNSNENEVPDVLWLAAGEYFVEVEAGTPIVEAGWTAPETWYYKERRDFTVTAGSREQIKIGCSPKNTLLTVDFDESVGRWLTDYSVTLYPDPADRTKTLVFDEKKTAYMMLAEGQTSIDWEFNATQEDYPEVEFPKKGTLEGLEAGKEYTTKFQYTFSIKEGALVIAVTVDTSTVDKPHDIVISTDPQLGSTDAIRRNNVWAKHATVTGSVVQGSEVNFLYRNAAAAPDGEWQSAAATADGGGKYSAKLTGLTPGTKYETIIEVDGKKEGKSQLFTTEAAAQLPNGGFENWYQDGDKVWYANISGQAFWDSGNKGTVTAPMIGSESNNITTADSDVRPGAPEGSKSAKLKSSWFGALGMGAFAAGNIYVGKFGATVVSTNPSGTVEFGRAFTSRPTAMSVWYKATTGTVNYAKSGAPISEGQQDKYQILIALAYIENPRSGGFAWQVDTADWGTFINYETDPRIVAHGSLESSDSVDWTNATITLNYHETDHVPTHIIVLASASMYGDYFAGSTSSIMWVDDFELIYE